MTPNETMTCIFQATAPDGTIEFLDSLGRVIPEAQARSQAFCGNAEAVEEERAARAKWWSIRGDVHLHDPQTNQPRVTVQPLAS